ncbi:MAG: hypothetical protein OXK19_05945 [Candidatus Dadabacteria bacterium]|nr:hypothetical protein [Candidatus Dadabacteria bacterium]
MSNRTAKILIGLVGVLVLGGFLLGSFEDDARCHLGKEKSHDVLERGEEVVLEYLTKRGWTRLKIHDNEILIPPEGEWGIIEAEAVVTGENEGNSARFVMRYGFDPDCEVYGVTVREKRHR